jgi:FkbM family methyltransferase
MASRMPAAPRRAGEPVNVPLPTDPPRDNSAEVVSAHGAALRVRPFSSDHGIVSETWDAYIARLAESGIEAFDDVLDLGAHIGGFSLQLVKSRRVAGEIVAVEPHPDNFALLQENVRANGETSTIKALNAAVSTANGKVRLAPSTTNNSGGHHLTFGTRRAFVEVEALDAATLIKRPGTVVKIDIEGWELPVLRRMRPLLQHVKAIVGELHTTQYAAPSDSVRLLARAGFDVRLFGDRRIPSFIAVR